MSNLENAARFIHASGLTEAQKGMIEGYILADSSLADRIVYFHSDAALLSLIKQKETRKKIVTLQYKSLCLSI